jgi:hypothetical protein
VILSSEAGVNLGSDRARFRSSVAMEAQLCDARMPINADVRFLEPSGHARRVKIVIRAGTIEEAVLEPIRTQGWTVKDLPRRVEEARAWFVDTLESWSG